jgi:hypothetical protein
VRDEAPKAPIMLYSLKNHNVFSDDEETLDDGVQRNVRAQLQEINQSLWLSELASLCDVAVPMDTPSFGKKALINGARYQDHNYFQKSALYAMAIDNLANHVYSGRFEAKDMV